MIKRNVSITLQNIDEKLETAIQKVIDNMSLDTIDLDIQSRCDEIPCPIIQVDICNKSKKGGSKTKEFMREYYKLSRNLQDITFKYMKATNSSINFEYGNYC